MLHSRKIIVLIPVFEDLGSSRILIQHLSELFGDDLFVLVVDDGSVNEVINESILEDFDAKGVILRLRRNVGHQRAIATGLAYLTDCINDSQRVVIMDSDGEDTPDSISSLLTRFDCGAYDVVVAKRGRRFASLKFKFFYHLYKVIFRWATGREINFGNFMSLNSRACRRLTAMQELNLHLAGTVTRSGLRVAQVPISRGERYLGRSKMNFVSLVLHGLRGFMVFAEDVLVRAGMLCAGIGSLSVLGILIATVLKINDYATPGWFSLAMGTMFVVLLQTGALALMMLMLTGVVRGGSSVTPVSYTEVIDSELRVY